MGLQGGEIGAWQTPTACGECSWIHRDPSARQTPTHVGKNSSSLEKSRKTWRDPHGCGEDFAVGDRV